MPEKYKPTSFVQLPTRAGPKLLLIFNLLVLFFITIVAGDGQFKAEEDLPHIIPQEEINNKTETESNNNLTATLEEKPAETEKERIVLDEVHTGSDVSVEEDSGHFNKNKDNQQSFSPSDEIQKVPQATLENPLDMGLGVKMEHSASGEL